MLLFGTFSQTLKRSEVAEVRFKTFTFNLDLCYYTITAVTKIINGPLTVDMIKLLSLFLAINILLDTGSGTAQMLLIPTNPPLLLIS